MLTLQKLIHYKINSIGRKLIGSSSERERKKEIAYNK